MNQNFIYHPESLTLKEYLIIALEEAQEGRFIPCYFYDKAANFASLCYDILESKDKWDRCYRSRIHRIALAYHIAAYRKLKV